MSIFTIIEGNNRITGELCEIFRRELLQVILTSADTSGNTPFPQLRIDACDSDAAGTAER